MYYLFIGVAVVDTLQHINKHLYLLTTTLCYKLFITNLVQTGAGGCKKPKSPLELFLGKRDISKIKHKIFSFFFLSPCMLQMRI